MRYLMTLQKKVGKSLTHCNCVKSSLDTSFTLLTTAAESGIFYAAVSRSRSAGPSEALRIWLWTSPCSLELSVVIPCYAASFPEQCVNIRGLSLQGERGSNGLGALGRRAWPGPGDFLEAYAHFGRTSRSYFATRVATRSSSNLDFVPAKGEAVVAFGRLAVGVHWPYIGNYPSVDRICLSFLGIWVVPGPIVRQNRH